MSEETNEMQGNDTAMDSAEFEARLTEFFTMHKESKMKFVPRIVEEFKGHESIVLEHLHNKYVLGIVAEKPGKKHRAKPEGHAPEASGNEAFQEEAKPKSRKKLIIISVAAVVLIALGVTGFLMKDKLFGKHEEPVKSEVAPAESTPPAEEPEEEAAPAVSTEPDSASEAVGVPDSAGAGTDTTGK